MILFEASGTLIMPADRPSAMMRSIRIWGERLKGNCQTQDALKLQAVVSLSHITKRRSKLGYWVKRLMKRR